MNSALEQWAQNKAKSADLHTSHAAEQADFWLRAFVALIDVGAQQMPLEQAYREVVARFQLEPKR